MPLANGAVFAGYVIEQLLGAGGMGEVYLATHPRLPRRDALKILLADVSADPDFRARFNREADVVATLYHPHIVGVHDRGEFNGQLWISMDYVEGMDAGHLLRDRYPTGMPRDEALDIITAIAEALDYAHERALLHRDIKPANILLSRPGSRPGRILLADFGIARREDEVSGLTATGFALGTVSYAAPEQLMGHPVDGRADQYALAATAFQLFSGAPPFSHSNPAVVISHHLNSPPPRLGAHRPELGGFDPGLSRALSKNPQDRFNTCTDFARALTGGVGRQPTPHGFPTTAAPTRPAFINPHPPPTEWGPSRASQTERRSAPPMPPTPPRTTPVGRSRIVLAAAMALVVVVVAVLAVSLFSRDRDGSSTADGGGGASGAGAGGGEGGDITISMTSFPDYVDPQLSYTLEGWQVLYNTYVPLLTYRHVRGEGGTQVVPGLATDMPEVSNDGRTYKLILRPNMKYSDGTPIKASDFAYAIQRLFKADSGGSVFYESIVGASDYAAGAADKISGITTDDNTGAITIELGQANGTVDNLLALPFAAPVPPTTPLEKDATRTPPPSSGPFMITHVEAPRTLTMERNPNFQTVKDAGATEVADAHVDKITITQDKSNSAQVTGVEQNTVDFMVDPPDADRLAEVKSKFADRFRLEQSINTYYFWMNTQTAPFNDIRVRQAINYAVDPEALNRVFGGRMHPTQNILPPGMPGYEESRLYPGPDMSKAKELLAEANPADRDITVWTDDEPDRKRIGEYYHDLLTQLGFNATLRVVAGDVYWATIGNQTTPDLDTGFGDWFQDFPHPDDFFRPLLNGASNLPANSSNYSRVNLPVLDAKTDQLLTQQLTDDVKRQYAALDKAYMEQAVWAPYGNEQSTTFVSDRIDFDKAYNHLVFNHDYSALALK